MKILINEKQPCEYCEWGFVKVKVTEEPVSMLSSIEHFQWMSCQMCEGNGYILVPKVIEADKDGR